uniref:hypothetical protein n=1 Tax=Parapedobacter tibetensis TaxID=2972951 RepID=UPI00214D5A97
MGKKTKKKEPKNVTKAQMETINRGRNLRPAGKAKTAINNDIHESTINSIEDQFNTAKYNFALINKLARGNKQNIADYLPTKPHRSNKLYPKFIISSVESFGPALALKALILN